jgi:FkbM family methyltransferase
MDQKLSKFSFEERYMAFMISTLNRMQSTSLYCLDYDGTFSRSGVLGTALKFVNNVKGICLEFGVHSGASLKLSAERLPNYKFFGFDSFKGFPIDGRQDWKKDFSIKPPSNLPNNCKLVKGFFDKTLPKFLKLNSEEIAFVNIDCDIYSSTKTVLDELEKSKRIGPGTIIYFDELINYRTALWNESLALFELLDRTGWGVEWLCVHQHVRGVEKSLNLLLTNNYPSWKENSQSGYLFQAALRIVPKSLDIQILGVPHIANRVRLLALKYKELTIKFNNGELTESRDNIPKKTLIERDEINIILTNTEQKFSQGNIAGEDLLSIGGGLSDPINRKVNEENIRARTKAVYLGNSIVLCKILGRYKFYVHGEDIGIAPHLILDGLWEVWTSEFVVRNIMTGSKTIDLGANYGYYTILMASLSGKSGQVYSVEPNPSILPFLEKNIHINKLNSLVKIDRRAISDKSGMHVDFYCPNSTPQNSKIVDAETAKKIFKQKNGKLVKVETIALDDLDISDISFIKVDLEGAEDKFWFGSKKFLIRNPKAIVLLEFNPTRLENPKYVLDDISNMYPLRYLWLDGKVYDTTSEYLIDQARGDWMLVLANRPIK